MKDERRRRQKEEEESESRQLLLGLLRAPGLTFTGQTGESGATGSGVTSTEQHQKRIIKIKHERVYFKLHVRVPVRGQKAFHSPQKDYQ